jgi:hypothetical protein
MTDRDNPCVVCGRTSENFDPRYCSKECYERRTGNSIRSEPVPKFRVYSKHPSAKTWLVERSYTLRLYADQAADSIRRNGRQAMVREVKE